MKYNRVIVSSVIVLAMIGFSLVFFSEWSKSRSEVHKVDLTFNSECLYEKGDCVLHLAKSLKLNVKSTPSEIRALERFQLSVSVPGSEAAEITELIVWVEGRDMDMGKHFLNLPEAGFSLHDGVSVSGVIPVCTIDVNMVWRLVMSFKHRGKLINVNLDLKTLNH